MNFKGMLTVSGKRIVTNQNEEYILKGLGIGGWLVKEGYMLKTPYPSPSTIDQSIEEVIHEDAKEFQENYISSFFKEEDAKIISYMGFNSIRIPFSYKLISPIKGKFLESGFEILDQVLSWCKKYDLYCILDLHCAPGSQNGQNISDDLSLNPHLYTEKEIYQPWVESIWEEIAKRYQNEPYIAGYDVINEPVLYEYVEMSTLRESYIGITKAIRKYDQNHILFIEGDKFSTKFIGLEPKWDDKIVIAFHKYWNETTQDSIQKYLDFQELIQAPLWLGESGENENEWFIECIDLCEKNHIGWNWWTIKKLENTTNPFNIIMPDDYYKLQDYWNHKTDSIDPVEANIILHTFLYNARIENCELLKDVWYALLRRDTLSTPQMYSPNIAPGKFLMAHYDLGRKGVSYGGPFEKSNSSRGGIGRNDCFYITRDKDSFILHFDVINSWLTYTILSHKMSDYKLYLYVSGTGILKITGPNNYNTLFKVSQDSFKMVEVGNIHLEKEIPFTMKFELLEGELLVKYIQIQ